jgi:hypothetical protein
VLMALNILPIKVAIYCNIWSDVSPPIVGNTIDCITGDCDVVSDTIIHDGTIAKDDCSCEFFRHSMRLA